MLKCLILAAGRGSRLLDYTTNIPKALVNVHNKPLLEWQLYALNKADIKDIAITTGYLKEKIENYNTHTFYNNNWNTMNMLSSIEVARSWLLDSKEVIICYSDIIYETQIINKLKLSVSDISTVVDINWKEYWYERFDNPLDDAESLKIDSEDNIIDIGRKVDTIQEIQAQYIGITKFTNVGMQSFFKLLDEVKAGKNLLNNRNYSNGYMTDILYELIKNNKPIKSVKTKGGWLEIDSPKDLFIANKILNKNILANRFTETLQW